MIRVAGGVRLATVALFVFVIAAPKAAGAADRTLARYGARRRTAVGAAASGTTVAAMSGGGDGLLTAVVGIIVAAREIGVAIRLTDTLAATIVAVQIFAFVVARAAMFVVIEQRRFAAIGGITVAASVVGGAYGLAGITVRSPTGIFGSARADLAFQAASTAVLIVESNGGLTPVSATTRTSILIAVRPGGVTAGKVAGRVLAHAAAVGVLLGAIDTPLAAAPSATLCVRRRIYLAAVVELTVAIRKARFAARDDASAGAAAHFGHV